MKKLASYRDAPSAYITASLLQSHDIPSQVVDEHLVGVQWLYSNAIGGVKVLVNDEDLDRASEIIFDDLRGDLVELGFETCPSCGSADIRRSRLRQIVGSLGLLIGFPIVAWSNRWRCQSCGETLSARADA